jgi:MFS transporter, DHA1 family, staphyloferrin B biosynthesis exporter
MNHSLLNNWKIQVNILWWGYTIIMAVAAMSLPYWPFYLSQLLPNSPAAVKYWSALIYLAPFISAAISAPLWGAVGDRFGYKAMLIRACFGLFITQILILCTINVFLIFIIRFLQGALAGVIVAAQAWALAISPNEKRGFIIGKLQSGLAVGELIGPLVGGIIATQAGYRSMFFLSSIVCLIITLVFYYALQNPSNVNHKVMQTSWSFRSFFNFKNMIHWNEAVYMLLLVIILVQLARSIFTPFFALFVRDQINGDSMIVGILYASTALSVFISAPLWGRYFDLLVKLNKSTYKVIATILFVTAIIQMLHSFTGSFTSIFILRLAWGVCIGALTSVLLRFLVDKANNDQQKGMVLGIGNSSIKIGNLIGAIVGAIILSRFGYTESFFIMSMFYFIAGGILLVMSKIEIIQKT